MKKLLIALGIVLLLAGSAAGTMYWQKIGPFETLAGLEEVEKEEESSIERPRFIQLDPLSVPLIKDNEVIGNIQLAVSLEAESSEDARLISRAKPRLSDAFLRDLYQHVPRYLRREPQIDIAVIKKRLKVVADRVLGEGVVKEVLVQGVMANPPR